MAPAYLKLYTSGELNNRIKLAKKMLRHCTVCPQKCRVDRVAGSLGLCGVGKMAQVSSYGPHFGEERPLVGQGGSGTIFFASCNLLCLFCQNYDISHSCETESRHLTSDELAAIMVDLQQRGCHNINFVTPSHVVPQILTALPTAIERGLKIPLVYNSSGYDSPTTIELLDGIIDIYLPDFKFWSNDRAEFYTKSQDYGDVTRNVIRRMYHQVGDLIIDEQGIAERGLLIRHLVMPDNLDETEKIISFIAKEISPTCYVNIMDQYRPCGQARAPIDRSLSGNEFQQAVAFANNTGLIQLNENRLADILRHLVPEK